MFGRIECVLYRVNDDTVAMLKNKLIRIAILLHALHMRIRNFAMKQQTEPKYLLSDCNALL